MGSHARVLNTPLRDLHLPKGALIGTILRGEEIILPRGDDMILVGDEVIVFTLPDAVSEIERLFAE